MLPHDPAAERAVLGALLLDNGKLATIAALVSSADFYLAGHGRIFEAIRELVGNGGPADEVTIAGLSNDPGALAYLTQLSEETPTAANVVSYAKIVRDKSIARRLIAIGHDLQTAAHTESPKDAIEQASKRLFDLSRSHQDRRIVHAIDVAREAMRQIESLHKNPDSQIGVRTGFTALDEVLGGFQPGDLVVLAARPAMGKTALALNLLEGSALRHKKRGLLFELEMSSSQLALRAIASTGRVSLQRIKRGTIGDGDFARIARGANDFAGTRMVIDETPTATLADVRSVARQVAMEGGLDLVVIDYLQLMSSERDRDSREREVSEISRGLKQIAKELNVPVLALSQLNRKLEERSNKRPIMSDLRESGAIEQDADVIMFLYRDEVYDETSEDRGIAEVIVAKQRNGPTDTVRLKFDLDLQRFDNE